MRAIETTQTEEVKLEKLVKKSLNVLEQKCKNGRAKILQT